MVTLLVYVLLALVLTQEGIQSFDKGGYFAKGSVLFMPIKM